MVLSIAASRTAGKSEMAKVSKQLETLDSKVDTLYRELKDRLPSKPNKVEARKID